MNVDKNNIAVAPGARVTLFTKSSSEPGEALLSKRIALVDGRVESDGSACRMSAGEAEVVTATSAADLAQIIRGMNSANALALGCIKGAHKACVVTKSWLANVAHPFNPDGLPIISRSRQYIDYGDGPAWALIDFDKKGMPPEVAEAINALGGVWPALLSVVPDLAQATRVSRNSTSAGLRRSDTGEEIVSSGGEHHYILVRDGSDIDRALAMLHERAWLSGLGWFYISKSGQLIDRSLIDSAVRFGEHLVFEGPPQVIPPLVQDAAARLPMPHDGQVIDTRRVVSDLSAYEIACVAQLKQKARVLLEPLAAKQRAIADKRLAEDISKRTGVPLESAARTVAARHRGVLLPDVMLDFDDLGQVAVKAVLAEPDKYVGETLADPLEGPAYGRCKAMVLRSTTDPFALFINSFAHGGATYSLKHDARTAEAVLANAEPAHAVNILCAVMQQAEIEADERTALIAATKAKSGVGVRAIEKRLKAEQEHRVAAQRDRIHQQMRVRDKRPAHPLPASDAERGPIIRLVDDAFAADASAEPPMRNADGAIVAVKEREPWGLHQLTATGSNADQVVISGDAGDAGVVPGQPAPPEPTIAALSSVEVELLVEHHIQFETPETPKKQSRPAALQPCFIEALMAMGGASAMPKIRAINAAPLVAVNGKIITGTGLDRDTGLFHRIEPLRDCLPESLPTSDDVRAALRWLLDEWLVDVKANVTGKLLALMLCLSMIERVLLKERPAWFVIAGHRGGGKTTLINMLTTAVLGRMAGAANWSDNEEERRKALFSYLRQGVAVLCWDNIPRGAKISSPCIEKALTSAEVSDRVLGESTFENAPGGTVQIFTGNSIGPKGDMCSRSFPIVINVDRPDPENRRFVHPDPIAWTEQHRWQILRSLYTILIYGCHNRPEGQIAKTRFKDWWLLCGWPIEHAASLIGEHIDCLAALRAGEGDDEETAAVSTMLDTLHDLFRDRPFTAREVVNIIEDGSSWQNGPFVPPEKKERAEKLLDAFGELLGRGLDRPTAGTIGKLLNNRLVDRPTFMGSTIATLKKYEEGHAGRYYISVVKADRDPNLPSAGSATDETISPMSRISRQHGSSMVDPRGDEEIGG